MSWFYGCGLIGLETQLDECLFWARLKVRMSESSAGRLFYELTNLVAAFVNPPIEDIGLLDIGGDLDCHYNDEMKYSLLLRAQDHENSWTSETISLLRTCEVDYLQRDDIGQLLRWCSAWRVLIWRNETSTSWAMRSWANTNPVPADTKS